MLEKNQIKKKPSKVWVRKEKDSDASTRDGGRSHDIDLIAKTQDTRTMTFEFSIQCSIFSFILLREVNSTGGNCEGQPGEGRILLKSIMFRPHRPLYTLQFVGPI
ncbi:hypothetical protein ACROYT_G025205 [Oculina patagonica]